MDNLAHISFTGTVPVQRPSRLRGGVSEGNRSGNFLPVQIRRREVPQPLDPLATWLLQRAGLQPEAYRAAAMERRVNACLRRLRVTSADLAREVIEREPEKLGFAMNAMLIGVSEFFRDRAVFDYLKESVLVSLAGKRSELRVCSVGASGGQELYSVAMLLDEAGLLEQSSLLGVDCREDAIRRAREGVFGGDDMEGVGESRRLRYFLPDGLRWRARPVLRERIRWRVEDLLQFRSSEPCDLILFRNVAIYFNETHSAQAWSQLCGQLTPGGYIVTGKAEKPPAALPLTRVAPSIYIKHSS